MSDPSDCSGGYLGGSGLSLSLLFYASLYLCYGISIGVWRFKSGDMWLNLVSGGCYDVLRGETGSSVSACAAYLAIEVAAEDECNVCGDLRDGTVEYGYA